MTDEAHFSSEGPAACLSRWHTHKAPTMTKTNRPLPYAEDIKTIPADEPEDIQALELILARSQAKGGQFRADVHVKTHADSPPAQVFELT